MWEEDYPPDGLLSSNSRNMRVQQKWGHAYLSSLGNPKAAETEGLSASQDLVS